MNILTDLAEWLDRLTASAEVATILGPIPASSETVESEGAADEAVLYKTLILECLLSYSRHFIIQIVHMLQGNDETNPVLLPNNLARQKPVLLHPLTIEADRIGGWGGGCICKKRI
jgi:hypothetical protein